MLAHLTYMGSAKGLLPWVVDKAVVFAGVVGGVLGGSSAGGSRSTSRREIDAAGVVGADDEGPKRSSYALLLPRGLSLSSGVATKPLGIEVEEVAEDDALGKLA